MCEPFSLIQSIMLLLLLSSIYCNAIWVFFFWLGPRALARAKKNAQIVVKLSKQKIEKFIR
jgi:hypothetical protein